MRNGIDRFADDAAELTASAVRAPFKIAIKIFESLTWWI